VRPEVFTALEQRARQEAARKAALGKLMGMTYSLFRTFG
jgi:hypothetical protein